MLIISKYIAKHELKPLLKHFGVDDIIEGAEKVLRNITIAIKPPQKLPGFQFFKVRVGEKDQGRMIVFMMIENRKVVPLLIRLKKDKIFGMNMAMNNPRVVDQIKKNLSRVLSDIQQKKYEEFPL